HRLMTSLDEAVQRRLAARHTITKIVGAAGGEAHHRRMGQPLTAAALLNAQLAGLRALPEEGRLFHHRRPRAHQQVFRNLGLLLLPLLLLRELLFGRLAGFEVEGAKLPRSDPLALLVLELGERSHEVADAERGA